MRTISIFLKRISIKVCLEIQCIVIVNSKSHLTLVTTVSSCFVPYCLCGMAKKFDAIFADSPKFSTINVKINPNRKVVLQHCQNSYFDEPLDKLSVLKEVCMYHLSIIRSFIDCPYKSYIPLHKL